MHCSVWVRYGHTTTFLSEYCRRNTQGDGTVQTESKNVCARNTKQRPALGTLHKMRKSSVAPYCCDKKTGGAGIHRCSHCVSSCHNGTLYQRLPAVSASRFTLAVHSAVASAPVAGMVAGIVSAIGSDDFFFFYNGTLTPDTPGNKFQQKKEELLNERLKVAKS